MRAYSDTLRRYFAGKAAQIGFPYVDTTPFFRARAQRLGAAQPLYFRSNVHLTPPGHRVVAEAVAPLIR